MAIPAAISWQEVYHEERHRISKHYSADVTSKWVNRLGQEPGDGAE